MGNRVRRVDAPLYRFSFYGLLAAGVACTAIGIADRAVEEFKALAAVKTPQNSSRVLAERPSAQDDVARAEATVRSATAFLHDAMGDAWESASGGDELSDDQRRMIRLANTDATQRCADTVNRLYRSAGGEAVYDRCAAGEVDARRQRRDPARDDRRAHVRVGRTDRARPPHRDV